MKLYPADLYLRIRCRARVFLYFRKYDFFPSRNTRVFSIAVSEFQKFQKSFRRERKRGERDGEREGEREILMQRQEDLSFQTSSYPCGCTISCSSESQDSPGTHEERRCFENKDTLPCSVIVITAIRNDLMVATNCITHVHESP